MSCCFPLFETMKKKFKNKDLTVSLINIPNLGDSSDSFENYYTPPEYVSEQNSPSQFIQYLESLSKKKNAVPPQSKKKSWGENRAIAISVCFHLCSTFKIRADIFEQAVFFFDNAFNVVPGIDMCSLKHVMIACLAYSSVRNNGNETTEQLLEKFDMKNVSSIVLSLLQQIDFFFTKCDIQFENYALLSKQLHEWTNLLDDNEKMNIGLYLFYIRTLDITLLYESEFVQTASILLLSEIVFSGYEGHFEKPNILFGSELENVGKCLKKFRYLLKNIDIEKCCISLYFANFSRAPKILDSLQEEVLSEKILSKFVKK